MTDSQWAVELVRRAAASHFSATPPNWSAPLEPADDVPRCPNPHVSNQATYPGQVMQLVRRPGDTATSTDFLCRLTEKK